ncbi:MAG: 1-acyl-sn-glycerol-3-phosphate acyltransferase [Tranquillimonas sp.]
MTLPLWLLVLLVLFATVTFASHFLLPSVRWFLRRRMEHAVARLNRRLARPIQPFKLAARTDTIQRVIYDPAVASAVTRHARERGLREDVAFQRARAYAREIVPGFSASVYFGVAIRAARWLSTRLYDVRVVADERVDSIPPDAAVVFVMNHRSNMDYVLVTYLAADRSVLSYAVGEWARVWPLSSLIRSMGAYFIRRRERNALYRRVLARYVQLATEEGVTQAIFPEGGLSQDGRLAAPRLGLLSYIIEGARSGGRPVVFVPVALNYDRIIEDRVLTEAAATGDRRFRGSLRTGAAFALRWIWRRARGKARRFGIAAVQFGAPVPLQDMAPSGEGPEPERVAAELMARLDALVPVLPVPLVSAVLAQAGGALPRGELLARCRALAPEGPVQIGAAELEAAIDMLELRRLIVSTPAGLAVRPECRALLAFYAASVEGRLAATATAELAAI